MRNNRKQSKWRHIDTLRFDVNGRDGLVLLKAGTKNVDFVPRGGCFTYLNSEGETVRANKYRDSFGRIYYGH